MSWNFYPPRGVSTHMVFFPSGFIIIVIRSLHRSIFKVLMFNFAGGSNCGLFAIAVAFNFIPFYVHMMKL